MSDQVVQTAVDVTALSGMELRKAVATALGWRLEDKPLPPSYVYVGDRPRWWVKPNGDPGTPPSFEDSLDACFAPGGPVERLKQDGHVLIMKMDGLRDGTFSPLYTVLLDNLPRTDGDNLPTLVCRAFLTAVQSAPVQGGPQ